MIKVAALGAGYFSQFHLDGWRRLDKVDLVGVADLDTKRAAASGAPAFSDLAQMLHQTKPDILDIIVPPKGHAAAIKAAIAAEVKAIICQKPFCTSLAEARDMATLAQTHEIPLIVHENFRFQPWYRAIKSAMDNGAIGQPLQSTFRLRPGDGQGPDAYLARQPYFQKMERFLVHETAVHWIDTFRYLFGDPDAVYADLRQINPAIAGEDAGIILFDHPHGVRTIFDGNRHLDHAAKNTRCTMGEGLFEGTEGALSLLGDGSVRLRKFNSLNETEIHPANISSNFGGDCTFHLQRHVVDSLTQDFPLENQAINYLIVREIEDAIYASARSKMKVKIARNDNDPK